MTAEIEELVTDTLDAIAFPRAQMFARASPQDGNAQGDGERTEYGREVSTGAKPKSKPPFNVDAMDAADAEMAVLVRWAEALGIPYSGVVWRARSGDVKGVLYGDTRPARSLGVAIHEHVAAGWQAPTEMVDEIRAVRNGNRKAWPELDVFLSRPEHERVADCDPDQYTLMEV